MQEPTKRQKQVLDFIRDHISREGYPPSIAEIASELDIPSGFAVRKHLLSLEKKGFIVVQPNTARGIRLCDK